MRGRVTVREEHEAPAAFLERSDLRRHVLAVATRIAEEREHERLPAVILEALLGSVEVGERKAGCLRTHGQPLHLGALGGVSPFALDLLALEERADLEPVVKVLL